VQAITLALVEKWGYEGFTTHTEVVAEFYREKRDTFEKALQTHLGDLAEWRTPEAGMFFWWVFLQFGLQNCMSWAYHARYFLDWATAASPSANVRKASVS